MVRIWRPDLGKCLKAAEESKGRFWRDRRKVGDTGGRELRSEGRTFNLTGSLVILRRCFPLGSFKEDDATRNYGETRSGLANPAITAPPTARNSTLSN